MGHDHAHPSRGHNRQRLLTVLVLTALLLAVQAVGGLLTGSLALLADAGHLLTDVVGLGLALFAMKVAERPPTEARTYGYHRVEILAALLNGAVLVGICFFILYEALSPQTRSDLWVLPLFADKKPQPFLQTPFAETMGRFSPDGKWIAYVSDESGTPQVYVQPFPASGGKWQISTQGGLTPRWRGDGKELFFLSPDRQLMSADVNPAGATFEASSPKTLFQTQVDTANISNRYDVSRDGQRFLMSLPVENTVSPPITVITNWLVGIERKR